MERKLTNSSGPIDAQATSATGPFDAYHDDLQSIANSENMIF